MEKKMEHQMETGIIGYIGVIWASSENPMLKFSYKTTMAGLEGLPRKVAMVFAKGTLDFAREVS